AYAGQTAAVEVATAFVGSGAPIKIKGKSEKGKNLRKISDKIRNNKFIGELEIPEDIEIGDQIYFEVELPDNGLSGESNRIPVRPAVQVSGMKWSAKEARRGDVLTLSADIKGLFSGTEVELNIYEFDRDKIHDKIASFPAVVQDEKLEAKWEYEYHDNTKGIPTDEEMKKYNRSYNPPEYFFTIKVGDTEYGKDRESGILKFRDWFDIYLKDEEGNPMPDEQYVLDMPDGSQRKGKLDGKGYAREEKVPPGVIYVEFPNVEYISDRESDSV
ncbi:MAG: hypothetical protein JSU69_08530, partial [Candidatus Zixiibacteriota bacterium]